MTDLNTAFEQAVIESKQLPTKPAPQELLELYALFKQASVGDNTEAQPGFTDIVARAKWDSWTKRQGMNSETAKQSYIDLVRSLQEKYRS